MEKEAILSIARSFLAEPYSEEYINKLAGKNHKKFLNNLSTLDERQIVKVLAEHPEYSNKELNGWHSLHYAALLNNSYILDKFVQNALKDGLSSLPRTTAVKKNTPAGLNLLTFCAAMNCDKSYAKLLTYLSDPEQQDFKHALSYSILFNSTKSMKFLQKLLGPEQSQQHMLEFFNRVEATSSGSRSNIQYVMSNHFKYNPERFDDYGVDVTFQSDKLRNYFTLTAKCYADNYYEIENLELSADKLRKSISYFIEKGFSFDTPDAFNDTPRKYLDEFKESLSSSYHASQVEKIMKELEQQSLQNNLPKVNTVQPKKIKI